MTKMRLCRICNKNISLRHKTAVFCKECGEQRRRESRRKCTILYNKTQRKIDPVKKAAYERIVRQRAIIVLRFFKTKYNCRTIRDLYQMIENGKIQ